MAAFALDRADRLARGPSGGQHVFDNDDGIAGCEAAFDALPRAVVFRLLPHGKRVEQLAAAPGGQREGVGDGIGAERQTAHGPRAPAARGQAIETQAADDGQAITGHRGEAGVDINRGTAARGEDEIAAPYGAREEEILERITQVVVVATTIHCFACQQCFSMPPAGRAWRCLWFPRAPLPGPRRTPSPSAGDTRAAGPGLSSLPPRVRAGISGRSPPRAASVSRSRAAGTARAGCAHRADAVRSACST